MRKNKKSRIQRATFTLLPLTLAFAQALANPDGGVIVGGQASISQVPGVTIVDQASNRAIINWNGFSIAPGELTKFNQPGKGAIALNRVLGNDPSQLLGQLQANGHVWLVNPNGILFGPSARVDVHGLLATTADITDRDFLAGRNHFSIPSPNAEASVVNQGNISIGEHGLAALVAPHARNAGIIQGKMGQVVIAGAPTFTLDFYGDGLIQFEATSKVTENTDPADPLVRNDGTISVDGGNVLITANAAAGIVDETINMDGIIEARSVGMENGVIVLKGGDEGLVRVAGSLDASGRDAGETGGTIKVLGEKVALYAGTRIDASGDTSGGEVLIGGNFQGKGAEPNAKRTYVASGASIDADAVTRGDGGKVIVWADEVTGFAGDISATGGINSGDGGFVEVSGKQYLSFEGTVDVSANNGHSGTLLLDPENITIIFDGGEGAADDLQLIDNEILFDDPAGKPGVTFTISETVLERLAADANIILEATNNITIDELLEDNTLNFQATTGSVTFRADGTFTSQGTDIETQGGNVTIEAGFVAGTSMQIRSNGGNITIEAQSDVFLGSSDTSGPLGGGDVAITSNGGTVNIGNLNASSATSNGGEVAINASGSIFTGAIVSSGVSAGGNVQITSTTGAIAKYIATEFPPLNSIDTSSKAGTGGSVDLIAPTIISVAAINTSGALASGDITLESDQLDLTGGIDSVRGPGADLLIQPSSTNQNIVIAATGDGELDLTPTELAALANGFNTITIGRADGTGTITSLGFTSFSDPLILQSPGLGGAIVINASLFTNGNPLSLIAGESIDINANLTTDGGSIELTSDGFIDTTDGALRSDSTDKTGGDITLNAAGDITTGGQLISYGAIQGGDISITSNGGNIDIGDVIVAGDVVDGGEGGILFTTDLGGSININAAGNITTVSEIFSIGEVSDGNITLISSTGSISATGTIGDAVVNAGTGGNINLEASGSIVTENILSSGGTGGGDITITSSSDRIDTTTGKLSASTDAGNAGAVRLEAATNITTGDIFASSLSGDGGDITLISSGGAIDTSLGQLNSISVVGDAGAISADASGDITTGNIFASAINNGDDLSGTGSSGGITLNSQGGDISTGGLLSPSEAAFGPAGSSGDIVVTAPNGSITVDGLVWAFSNAAVAGGSGNAGDGGAVTLSALNDITVLGVIEGSPFSIQSKSRSDAGIAGNGSPVSITSTAGSISINGDINSSSIGSASSGSAGSVALNAAGTITINNIDANAGDLTTTAASGSGGAVALTASGDIIAGDITSAASGGAGGAIAFNSGINIAAGSITFGSISGMVSAPLMADAPGTIQLAGLAPNGADINIGTLTRPGNLLLPNTIDTNGGNVTLFVGDVYTFATDLTTNQGNFSLDGLQAITLAAPVQTNGGDVTVQTGGVLTLQAPIITSTGQALTLLVANNGFVNQIGENGLQPGDGRYLVYSPDPALDTRGMPVDQFSKRYNFPFNPDDPEGLEAALPLDDNFFLYEISPILSLIADNASRGMAESDPDFTYTFSGLIDGDTLDSALDELLILTTTAEFTSLPGDYPIEIGPMDLASTLGYTVERIDGNLKVDEGELGTIQSTNILLPAIPLDKQLIPVVPLVLTDQPGPTFAIPDLPTLNESSNPLSPNDGNRELWGTSR